VLELGTIAHLFSLSLVGKEGFEARYQPDVAETAAGTVTSIIAWFLTGWEGAAVEICVLPNIAHAGVDTAVIETRLLS
jgi:hypothetical protein